MPLSIGVGISPTLATGVGGYTFANSEASALVDRFTTQPDNTRKQHIDTLVGALKAAGVWSKLDCLYLMAAHDAQAARRNWVADQYNLTAVSSPAFTTDRGYAGNASSSYLKTGYRPSVALGRYQLDSAHISAYCRTSATGAGALAGARTDPSTGVSYVFPNNTASQDAAGINGSAGVTVNQVTNPVGSFTARRQSSGQINLFRSGASIATLSSTSAALSPYEIYFCGVNQADTSLALASTKQIASGSIGSGLSDAEIAAKDAAILTYLQAIGAA